MSNPRHGTERGFNGSSTIQEEITLVYSVMRLHIAAWNMSNLNVSLSWQRMRFKESLEGFFYLVFKSFAVHASSCKMWKTCSTFNRPALAAVNKTRFTPHNLGTLLCPCRWIWIYGVELLIHGTSSSLDSGPNPPVMTYIRASLGKKY